MKRAFLFIGSCLLVMLCSTQIKAESLNDIHFSKDGGRYDNSFYLSITSNVQDAEIYYTTDGSTPTTTSTKLAAGSTILIKNKTNEANVYADQDDMMFLTPYKPGDNNFKVQKANVIRAIAYKDGSVSNIVTKTYFVGLTKYNLPIVSIVTDPANLFDSTKGILVTGNIFEEFKKNNSLEGNAYWQWSGNFTQKGSTWEREAQIEFYDEKGNLGFSQDVGIRVQGNTTRVNNQKGFNIYGRNKINGSTKKTIDYSLFPNMTNQYDGSQISSFKNFTLRAGGDDTYYLKEKDTWLQTLMKSRNTLATQNSRPCVVFLDGEYWGIYNIREKYGDNYIESHYGINKDNVVMIKDGELETDPLVAVSDNKDSAEYKLYTHMLYYVGVGKEQGVMTDAIYKEWKTLADEQSFIDYYAYEILVGNRDWPYGNEILWRSRDVDSQNVYADGKWRWALSDMDDSLGHRISDSDYSGSDATKNYQWDAIGNAETKCQMFACLMGNADFKKKFVNTFMDLYNSYATPVKAEAILRSLTSPIEPYIEENYQRFGNIGSTSYSSDWKKTLFTDRITRDVTRYTQRYDWLPQYLAQKLSLKSASTVTFKNVSKVNTISTGSDTYSAKYFPDYSISVAAVQKTGYTFTGWTGSTGVVFKDATALTTTVTVPQSNVVVSANYVKTGSNSTNTGTTTVKKPGRVTIKSATNSAKKTIRLRLKKVSGAAGYQIVRATNKKFTKQKKIILAKSLTINLKKLKKGTTYYVKVRAYKKVSGKKLYGSYSAVKKVKVRK